MSFLRNLKIRSKLLVLLVVLLVPLVFFLILNVAGEIKEKNELENASQRLQETKMLSALLHEFQKEKALSNAYLSSQGENLGDQLIAQRRSTNAAVRQLEQNRPTDVALSQELQAFSNLPVFRRQIDLLKADSVQYEAFSLTVVDKLAGRIRNNATVFTEAAFRDPVNSYIDLFNAKLYLGRIRSLESRVFTLNHFSYQDYALFRTYSTYFEESLENFIRTAPENVLQFYQRLASTPSYQDVTTLVARINRSPDVDLQALDPAVWYAKNTAAIEVLRTAENFSMQSIERAVANAIALKNRMLVFYISFVLFTLALALVISFYVVRNISSSLQTLKDASDRVSTGYTNVQIGITSRDEIGELAASLRTLLNKNIHLAQVAEAVERGQYDVEVEVQSEHDVLSNAICRMKDSLQRFSAESENRNWLLTGIAELNTVMENTRDSGQIGHRVIHFLSEYIEAQTGAFFIKDDYEKLHFTAGFALQVQPGEISSFIVGEGVIGQVALDQTIAVFPEVPHQYLKIQTALTTIDPIHVLVMPLVYEKNTEGVIELASRKKFTPRQIKLLENAGEKIAIVLHTLKAHQKTQELLFETQNQAEELETQQEELRQINLELKARQEQLQASEEELRVSQEELEEKNSELEEKTQQLEEQYEATRTKNKELEAARQAIELKIQQVETISRYKSEFLANMSHELRTPLNSILILSKLLSENSEKNLTTKQVEHAGIIHHSGSDLLKLINEILDLAKIESGQIRLEVSTFDPRHVELQLQFEQTAREKGIDFRTEFADKLPPTLQTDQFRLEQIIKNLLSNAFKFTPADGSITLSVYPLLEKIRFKAASLRESDEIIAFAVADTGIGIPPNKLQLIFEAFQQADTSTTRKYGGTGLGLAISRELAGILGGEIHVQSEENKGSTFTLFLPRVYQKEDTTVREIPLKLPAAPATIPAAMPQKTAEVSQAPTPTAPVKANGKAKLKKRDKQEKAILIIEDDRGFSQIVADFAAHRQFTVYQAYNGQDGLQMALEHEPDAILLDINLPDISGWEVLNQVKALPDLAHIQVHIMSAYDKEVLGAQMNQNEYIPKPVTLEVLDKAFGTIRTDGKPIQRVLIVEDNQAENTAIAELLLAHGITSISALSGTQAYALLQQEKADCIILDLGLPDTGGYDLMEKVRKSGNDLPIIVYSGKELSEQEEFQLKKYANTIIIKNRFSYIRLLDEVQLFLHRVNEQLPGEEVFNMKLHIPSESLKDKKVLVVDDDVRNVYSLYSVLEGQQMKVVVANDGKEALQKLDAEKGIELILMDMMMPEMDGIETTRRIRQNTAFKSLPIIALTAKAMKGDKEKCLQAGASDYISKPIDVDKLLALMRVWLYKGV